MPTDFTLPTKAKKIVRESQVEADGKKRVAAAGGLSLKFKSVGRRSVPDQLELYGIKAMQERLIAQGIHMSDRWVRELLASAIQFTEYKRPGSKPTEAQVREHERFRALGFTVNVIDQRTPKEK